ncbi:unnamed protein product [Rotaria socialis]|nr:unnamed protein product [Rotaria socialis]CAF3465352.1 unnamed protein product [Rotaria socialis]CAF3722070.1 unnamed protein product [Rotaria socialis]CAF4487698.1 unnamed protein product [Rotaria socialis]CAF4526716.1 unnamed protein product [Rotaria socialis]
MNELSKSTLTQIHHSNRLKDRTTASFWHVSTSIHSNNDRSCATSYSICFHSNVSQSLNIQNSGSDELPNEQQPSLIDSYASSTDVSDSPQQLSNDTNY